MDRALLPALVLAVGVAAGGFLAGNGFARGRAAQPFVTVKGVAERDVRADLAIWPLRVVAADNDLGAANARIEKSVADVRSFLQRHGLDPANVSLQDFSVTDAATNQYGGQRPEARYVIHQTVVVRSEEPDKVLAASQQVAELVNAGVVLSSAGGYGSGGPTFIFSGLSKLKPDMIAEATAHARAGAEQFAHDSQSRVGGIKEASQGVFQILPRDQAQGISEASQVLKTVRVVSTIKYFLLD
jgi:hypothetical protein